MAKRYIITVDRGEDAEEHEIYVGQLWMDANLADYRKIVKISERKGQRLLIEYKDNSDGIDAESAEKQCDLDDFIIWVLDTGRKPLIVSYREVTLD